MTSEDYIKHPLIIHHVNIINRENRAAAEAMAVSKILNYYKSNFDKEFLYTESTFNTNGFAPLQSGRYPFDADVCAFMSANICVARKDIGFIARGRTLTDVETAGDDYFPRLERADNIFKSVLALNDDVKTEYLFPLAKFTKKEIWEMLPVDVRNNTWWCRNPIYSENERPKTCGWCSTCKDVKEFINE